MASKKSENTPRARASGVNVWCRFDEEKDVTDVIPNPRNPNKHPDKQIALLAKIIKNQGWRQPITISNRSGFIVKGHGRLQAAQVMNVEKVPVEFQDYATEAEEYADLIADNRIAELAEPDMLELGELLKDSMFDDFDMDLTGFDAGELDGLLAESKDGLTDEDAVPEVPEEPTSKLGQIWRLGDHRLMCGDSTSKEDVEKLMDGVKPDLIHTDPPYGMNAVTKSGVLSKNYKTDILGDDNPDVAKSAFVLIHSLYSESKQIWWGANYYSSCLPDSECWLVWDKNNGESDQTDCELAWANFRSVVRQFTQASEKTNRVHPTQKPVSLMEWIIRRFKLTSKTIADYFGGSGSTLIAAEKHGLSGYIMEFDPAFCDVIIKRWEDFTGKKAELVDG